MNSGRNEERRNRRKRKTKESYSWVLLITLVISQLVVETSLTTVMWTYGILKDAHAKINNME
jgi:hypothetical protein